MISANIMRTSQRQWKNAQTLTLVPERMTFESNYTLKRRNYVRVWEQMG